MSLPSAVQSWCDRLANPYVHPASGAVVVIVTAREKFFATYGNIAASWTEPPGRATLFEIGSITRDFTTILLAKFALDGRIVIDAPIAGAPEWITPRRLASHTSGLPRPPFTLLVMLKIRTENPYAGFTQDDLMLWMARYRPRQAHIAGQLPRYSNLGFGLHGQILAMIASSTFETVLRKEVLVQLGLNDTVISLSSVQQVHFAAPHIGSGCAPAWNFDALAGCGALRSTASDLAALAGAVIDAPKGIGTLHCTIAKSLEVQVTSRDCRMPDQCLGWIRLPAGQRKAAALFHNGGTRGSSSSFFVVPDAGVAMVVLANQG